MTPGERWLVAGAGVGALIAVLGLRAPGPSVPDDAIALVGDTPVSRAAWAQALAAVEAERPGHTDDPTARADVLERLVDEALLVEQGVEMGLPGTDPRSRALLATAVLDLWAAEVDEEPSPDELAAFRAAHGDTLRSPDRLVMTATWQDAEGAPIDPPLPVPGGPQRPDRLAELVGRPAVAAVSALEPGETTAPVPSNGAFVRLTLDARAPGAPADDAVVAEAWRAAQEEAHVRARLDALRDTRRVTLAPDAP